MTEFKRPITQKTTVAGYEVPVFITTGNYYLRIYPFSSNTYTGTYSNGVWDFGTIVDGEYQIWNATSQLANYGTFWIGDTTPTLINPTLSGVTVAGTMDMVGNDITYADDVQLNSLSESTYNAGISANDKFIFCGNGSDDTVIFKNAQVQFDANTSVNYNGGDIAHVDNLQVDSFTENTSSAGLTSNCHTIFSQGIEVWGGGLTSNFYHPVKFSNYVPQCTLAPTLDHHLTNKEYVDNLVSTTGIYASLTVSNSFSGTNEFTQGINVYGGGLTSNFYHPVKFNMYVPSCILSPTQDRHLTNRGFVRSEIATQMSSIIGGAYQESPNIIRLIPNGTTTGSVYATWNEAVTYANANATSNKQITILITGNGTGGSNIGMSMTGADFVHFRGLGASVVINPYTQGFGVSAVGRGKYEDLEFYMNDSENPFSFTNHTYKNMILNCVQADGNTYTLYNCNFEEGVICKGLAPTLVNCTGSPIFSENPPIISSGTSNYNTNITSTIGTQKLTDNGSVIVTHSLSGTGVFSATSMNIGETSLTGNGTELYVGGMLKTNSSAYIGGETNINGRLNATGDVTFFSNRITEKATNTISLSANVISLTGAISIDQIPVGNKIEFILGDGQTYFVNVELKT